MTPGRRGWIVLAIIATYVVGIWTYSLTRARSAELHSHKGAAGRFYSTWMMPDAPHASCCSDEDCAPAASKFEGGTWWARWSEEEEWVRRFPPRRWSRTGIHRTVVAICVDVVIACPESFTFSVLSGEAGRDEQET